MKISAWRYLTGGRGRNISVCDKHIVLSDLDKLYIWNYEDKVADYHIGEMTLGNAKCCNNKIYWGSGYVELKDYHYSDILEINEILSSELGESVIPSPTQECFPVRYAWSPSCTHVAVSFQFKKMDGESSCVYMISLAEKKCSLVWSDSTAAPNDVCLTQDKVILGTYHPLIINYNGEVIKTLHDIHSPVKFDFTDDDPACLVLEQEKITLWDAKTWRLLHTWIGDWHDAAISPDGKLVVMVKDDVLSFAEKDSNWEIENGSKLHGNAYSVELDDDSVCIAIMGQEGVIVADIFR